MLNKYMFVRELCSGKIRTILQREKDRERERQSERQRERDRERDFKVSMTVHVV